LYCKGMLALFIFSHVNPEVVTFPIYFQTHSYYMLPDPPFSGIKLFCFYFRYADFTAWRREIVPDIEVSPG
jgi:hypothetical protein